MTRMGMVVDLKACIGCHACAMACKTANNLPNDVWWNRVITDGGDYMDTARGTYPNDLHRQHYPTSCQHCASPACVEVCPTGASSVQEDGTVLVDIETCIGCRSCVEACPYGVRIYMEDEPAYAVDGVVMGDWDAPAHKQGIVEKCTFCYNRRQRGEKPACMEACPALARHFGDFDDPGSEVSRLVADREHELLLEKENTNPQCYYLL